MKVNKRTRAKKDGTWIKCPNCNKYHIVYHFSWSALRCCGCKTDIDKYDWKLEPIIINGFEIAYIEKPEDFIGVFLNPFQPVWEVQSLLDGQQWWFDTKKECIVFIRDFGK
jgi:uncharacterized protein (DUF983 family)